jgi:hypothetical protein
MLAKAILPFEPGYAAKLVAGMDTANAVMAATRHAQPLLLSILSA